MRSVCRVPYAIVNDLRLFVLFQLKGSFEEGLVNLPRIVTSSLSYVFYKLSCCDFKLGGHSNDVRCLSDALKVETFSRVQKLCG